MKTLKYYPSKGKGEPGDPNQQRQNAGSGGREQFSSLVDGHERKSDETAPS